MDMHMNERVTVTLPKEIIRDINRQGRNRSRFVLQAVQKELERRRKEELRRSLRTPHQDDSDIAEAGFVEWAEGLPVGDEDLIDINAGVNVKWVPGQGWVNSCKRISLEVRSSWCPLIQSGDMGSGEFVRAQS